MNLLQEKSRRLAEWQDDLNNTVICGSLLAWHRIQLLELNAMREENLLSSQETLALRELAIRRYCALSSIKN